MYQKRRLKFFLLGLIKLNPLTKSETLDVKLTSFLKIFIRFTKRILRSQSTLKY